MLTKLDTTAATLADTAAGWVTRRDAAEQLGEAAARAVAALSRFANETDVDVRSAVLKELAKTKAAFQKPPAEAKALTLDDLACGLAKEGERTVTVIDHQYAIDFKLKTGRRQRVYLGSHEIREGTPLIRVMTICGQPVDTAYEWALRANVMLAHGAIALMDVDDVQQVVIVRYFAATDLKPAEILTTIKEIAYYGDWIESKLSGKDEL